VSEPTFFKVTNRVAVQVGDDRFFELSRGENGGYLFEWSRPADDEGSVAVLTTKVMMTEASFLATIKGGLEMMKHTGDLEDEPPHVDPHDQDAIDAERYRKWRDGACYRASEVACAIAQCITPSQIDDAIDKLPR
jgi:hypothetical protein